MNLMRVYQTAGLIPQRLLFFLAVFADVHNLWRLVNAFAVFEDWNEKFAHGVGARREVCLFPCLDRIEEQKGILLIKLFIHETDQICDNLASLLVIVRWMVLLPGLVTFSVFSESLIFGINLPV